MDLFEVILNIVMKVLYPFWWAIKKVYLLLSKLIGDVARNVYGRTVRFIGAAVFLSIIALVINWLGRLE